MQEIGARQYVEASRDPRGWQPEPGMVIRPFHAHIVGMEDLFHVYCERHPEFGFCGNEDAAREEALQHAHYTHVDARSSEGSGDDRS